MSLYDVIAVYISKFLHKLIPKLLALIITLLQCFPIFWIGSPHLHPDGHHRTDEGAANRSLMPNAASKSGGQLRKCRILYPKIVLETQGNGLCSVKSLIEITLRLF